MKKIISNSLNILLVAAIGLFGCQDLDVINTNQPDEARALATPSDIESLIAGSFLSWHDAIEDGDPAMGLAVMSDAYTCSWGNYGMS